VRTHLRKPWVAAAVVTVGFVVISAAAVALTDSADDSSEAALNPLLPQSIEIVFALLSVVVLYLVLWISIALAARLTVRRP